MSNYKQMNMREGDIEDDSIYGQENDEQYDCSDGSYNDGENELLEDDYESGYESDSAETSSGMKNTPCPVSVPKLSQLAASTCNCRKCVSFEGENKECTQLFTTYDDVKRFHKEAQRLRFAAIEAETDREIAEMRAVYKAKWAAEEAEEKKWKDIMDKLPREPKAVIERREAAKRALIKKKMDEARANRKRRPGGGDRPLGSTGRVIDAEVMKARKALKRKENRDTNKREENIRSENFARNVSIATVKLQPQEDKTGKTVKTEEQNSAEIELKEHNETVRKQILEIQLAKFEEEKIQDQVKKIQEIKEEERKKREEEKRKLEEEEAKEEEKHLKALITARSALELTKPVKKVWDNVNLNVNKQFDVVDVVKVIKTEEKSKVVMCRLIASGQKCHHGDNCWFSHKASDQTSQTSQTSQPISIIKSNVMCRSIRSGEKCFHGVNCRFSHPVTAFAATKPTLAEICKQGFSVLTTDSSPHDKTRNDAFVTMTDENKIRDKRSLTKMCISVGSGKPCRHGDCRFAHNIKELKMGECFFGEKCNHVYFRNGKYENVGNKNCRNMHPNETVSNFDSRTQIKSRISMVFHEVPSEKELNIRHVDLNGGLREQAVQEDGWQVKRNK